MRCLTKLLAIVTLNLLVSVTPASAEVHNSMDARVHATLVRLLDAQPELRVLYRNARGVLIIPEIRKAGLLFGNSYGVGALIEANTVSSYYSLHARPSGLNMGGESAHQIVFFLTHEALNTFKNTANIDAGQIFTGVRGRNRVQQQITVPLLAAQTPVVSLLYNQDGDLDGPALHGTRFAQIAH